ncbi:MAG TPA: DUF1415 family protein [Polyangiaceae bacterium]|jgi:hypothetical protein|nr:DUF1415 family protein [Polyangiaceae bacterium]
MDDALLSREAVRLYRRYQTEVVEALRLCPWAERARLDGRVREHVVLTAALDADAALAAMTTLSEDTSVDIGLLIFPRLRVGFADFERFVSDLVTKDAERRELGTAPFALAAFHPWARADLSEPERTIPFLRRTPDPTIQLVRYTVLESVREGFNEGTQFIDVRVLTTLDLTRENTLPLRERIARSNHRTVTRLGVEAVEERLDDILRDREASYGSGDPRALPG